MQINYSGAMIGVVVIALAVVVLARGRWNGPVWLVAVGAVLAHPFAHPLMDQVDNAPDGWLRWSFQVACGVLFATLAGPVVRGCRHHGNEAPSFRTASGTASRSSRAASSADSPTD
ncbi:hypothetical protein [Streptomyces albicerus]|uniref:hypothetical protein n=1 Tax=Streptomyces albicerus TaxID=2569859 RepID=UPI00124AEC08|nr:hypothetical protein [Streptomyces albicerus]